MNMNDAFLGSLIFNKNGGGGGDTPLTFTKTTLCENSNDTGNLKLSQDYHNFDLVIFHLINTTENTESDFVTTPSMIDEYYSLKTVVAFIQSVSTNANQYVNYSKISNTEFGYYARRNCRISAIYGLKANKSMIIEDIYKRGNNTYTNIDITTTDDIFQKYDLILFGGCQDAVVSGPMEDFIDCGGLRDNMQNYTIFLNTRYNWNAAPMRIFSNYIPSFMYFYIQGIKFT